MYSMELSLLVLEAGIKLLRERRPELLYLSLTDWVQHKWAPDEDGAREFYRKLDDCVGRLAALDATVALTADHGMSDKSTADGEPKVIWLQDLLDAKLGAGTTTVICPITDAFVAHHGALGGFVRVWSRGPVTARQIIDAIGGIDGIELALDRDTACRMFDMPADREGDVAVIARQDWCIGSSAKNHDLSAAEGPPPAHARRHLGDQGAVHPEPAAERGLPHQGGQPVAEELPDLRLRDQRDAVAMCRSAVAKRRRRQQHAATRRLAARASGRSQPRAAGARQRGLPAPERVHALPGADRQGRRPVHRGHGRPALHGLPWQQRAPPRPWPSGGHRRHQAAAR